MFGTYVDEFAMSGYLWAACLEPMPEFSGDPEEIDAFNCGIRNYNVTKGANVSLIQEGMKRTHHDTGGTADKELAIVGAGS